jgi:predicted transcriptional regulator
MMPPIDVDSIDLNPEIIEQLDAAARKLKITRQALIKQFIRQGLNEQNLSQKQRRAG